MSLRAAGFAALIAASVALLSLSLPAAAHGGVVAAIALAGVIGVVAGIRRRRMGGVTWLLLVVSGLLNLVATVVLQAPVLAGGQLPSVPPAPLSVLWVAGDLLLAAAIAIALSRRERPTIVLLDLGSIAIGAGLVVGVAVLEPALAATVATPTLRVTQVASLVCDVLLISAVLRVLLAPRGRPVALWLLAVAATCVVVSDLRWSTGGRHLLGGSVELGWELSPLLVAAAALHPSMGRLDAAESRSDGELHVTGLLVLGLTSVISPMLFGAHHFLAVLPDSDSSGVRSGALMLGGLMLSAIVVWRFMLLIRRARRLADRSEERYQNLVEQVPAVVVMFEIDEDGQSATPVYVSPQAETIVGLRAADWLADPVVFASRIDEDDLQMLIGQLHDQLAGAASTFPEFRFTRPDGEEIWLRDVSGVVSDDHRGRYLQAMLFDITEAKRAEAGRLRMEGELRLAQKLEAVGELAAGIAHEINTPTQFVGDTIRFLQDAFDGLVEIVDAYEALGEAVEAGRPVADSLQRVRVAEEDADLEYLRERVPAAFARGVDGVSRVATIVRAMRDFAHPPTLEKAPVDIVAALRDTLIMSANAYKYIAEVETDFDDLPLIMANGGELNQVFLNLVVNAAHAIESVVGESGQLGRIRLAARADADDIVVSVSDTGCGIPDEVAERVFDPFFTTKEVGRGTGQGLAIARTMVVERHGGTLSFDTDPGQGTTFHVRLPVAGNDALAFMA